MRTVYNDMNTTSYRTETETETIIVTDEYSAIVLAEHGEPMTETKTTQQTDMYITVRK